MRDDVYSIMSRTSLMMLISSVMELLSIIAVVAASNFVFTGLPPSLSVKYGAVAFPSINLVTGIILLFMVFALIGGFMTYVSRGSLERREFLSLGNVLYTSMVMAGLSFASTVVLLILYSIYLGPGGMTATQSLTLGFTSLILGIALSAASLGLLYVSLLNARELRRRYRPRTTRRQRPPPPPPQVEQGDYTIQ
jgi:hypothetical protein